MLQHLYKKIIYTVKNFTFDIQTFYFSLACTMVIFLLLILLIYYFNVKVPRPDIFKYIIISLNIIMYFVIQGNTKKIYLVEKGENDAHDYVDIVFNIKGVDLNFPGVVILTASNKVGNITFNVVLSVDGAATFSIISLGKTSDNFVNYLAERLGVKNGKLQMKKEIIFSFLVLGGERLKVTGEPFFLKLFYIKSFDDQESEEARRFMEDEYFEIYLNIDLQNNRVQIREKDFDYRKKVIKALRA